MTVNVLLKALELGLILAVLSEGVYVSFRILNIPDMTVDGSFSTGAAVVAVSTMAGQPYLGLCWAFLAGCVCGLVTAFLQTKMKIQPLLAGIITMTGLYSINLRIMGSMPNMPLLSLDPDCASMFDTVDQPLLVLIPLIAVLALVLYWFFKTNLGLQIRATGDNEAMVRSSSINVDRMKFIAFGLSNGLVALSGALFAQYNHFADVTGGTGMMVIGLAGIIVGEAIIQKRTIGFGILSAILGACIYRVLYTLALQFGVPSGDMNLISALLVAITISIPYIRKKRRGEYA
ncbi:ABC transporter permease [Catenisphaera adipataccumulans]|jgi:putative ABC transport system permease protein|uniref:Putative ABC transport system permease protein n=1 Tax=Catenisphaera adipataccumulans TaxID=700500 RepID=A0A7W8FTX2_9FIRM|nr:ABC transporter permease [Catenisphaera adipataccumulans]MBB5182004.1 putative ABC transport system permease protein [Catenisphaera adipataccumulans]